MSRAIGKAFARIVARELDRLAREIEAYPDEADLWRVEGSVRNAPGTLALHLAGNLDHYVGAALGGSGYTRDRPAEFGDRSVPREEILRRVARAKQRVVGALEALDDDTLRSLYPGRAPAHMGEDVPAVDLLAHLTWHLGWHLGQIEYHRRLLVGGEAV